MHPFFLPEHDLDFSNDMHNICRMERTETGYATDDATEETDCLLSHTEISTRNLSTRFWGRNLQVGCIYSTFMLLLFYVVFFVGWRASFSKCEVNVRMSEFWHRSQKRDTRRREIEWVSAASMGSAWELLISLVTGRFHPSDRHIGDWPTISPPEPGDEGCKQGICRYGAAP